MKFFLNSNIIHEKLLNSLYQFYFQSFRHSSTIYIGNLSFHSNETQIYELFYNFCGIKRIIIGLHRLNKTPCGFCFLEFYNFKDAKFAFSNINGLRIDKRVLRIDLDKGFFNGRQYGRGKKGGQLKEEISFKNNKNNN